MTQINLTIDNKKVSVPKDTSIVEAAKKAGITIPTLCHRDDLKPFTSCFICVVEIKGRNKLEPACSTFVTEGMEVMTDSEEVQKTRKVCLELLISEHFGDCLSPCRLECPADCDIQGYIKAVFENRPEEAIKIIKETISIPASIGRICPRPCEGACRRIRKEGPAAICSLKRYVGDKDIMSDKPFKPQLEKLNGQKVAIIGGGPGGVNAAYFLRKLGYEITIFEAKPEAGGMMQYGIPQYRLPKELLQKEIQNILDLGIEIKYNTEIGNDITIDALKTQGFKAFLFVIGAQLAASMRVDGENECKRVLSGIDYLEKVIKKEPVALGNKVIVVGGGNTAIDAARTSLRAGSKVTIVYRRTKKEMPAEDMEIHAADKEGIEMQFLTAPIKVREEGGQVILTCLKMKLGEPDDSSRRRPVAIEGSEYDIKADTVISAIGQKVDASYAKEIGLELTDWNTIVANQETGQTNIPEIFAAGDCVLGPNIASAALGTARIAAISIDQFLKGEKVKGESKLFIVEMGQLEDIPEEFYADVEHAKRNKMPELDPKDRTTNFKEVELGFTDKQIEEESSICLECGCKQADDCIVRDLATIYKAEPKRFEGEKKAYFLDKSHPDLIFESNKCILCGCCVRYSNEVKKQDVMGFVDRGFQTVVRPAFSLPLADIKFPFSKELADVCPTGAISLK